MSQGRAPHPRPATHYDVLEVSPQASTPTIRAAYKSLMQRHHPDRLQSAAAQGLAQRINAAYEVLSDPEQRRRYDAALELQDAAASRAKAEPRATPPGAASAARARATARPEPAPRRAPAGAPTPATTPSRGSRLAAAFVALLSVFGIVGSVGLWWWTTPPAESHVGTVQYDPDSPVVQVIAQLGSLRDAQGAAQARLQFRTSDGRPFRIAGQEVIQGSSVVRYDCERRRFTTTQNTMQLVDGSVVNLVDSQGSVTPDSASERTLELACAPWWRRWKLL